MAARAGTAPASGVGRSAERVSTSGRQSCRVDLARFEQRWKCTRYGLHARLRGPAGSWEVRVTFVHYDAVGRVLRARGRLENHEATGRAADTAIASQFMTSTEIVFASTFIPFDSSF